MFVWSKLDETFRTFITASLSEVVDECQFSKTWPWNVPEFKFMISVTIKPDTKPSNWERSWKFTNCVRIVNLDSEYSTYTAILKRESKQYYVFIRTVSLLETGTMFLYTTAIFRLCVTKYLVYVSYHHWRYLYPNVGPVAQSVWRLTTGWTVRDRIPVGMKYSARPDRPWGPPILL